MFAPFAGLLAIYFDSVKPAVTGGTSEITRNLRLGGRSSPAISPALNRLRGRSEGEKELARYLAGLESRGALSERPTMTLELNRNRLGEAR